jgi:hypothetical protein
VRRKVVIIPQVVRSVTLVLSLLTPFLSLLTLLTPVFDPSCPQLSLFLTLVVHSCPVVVQFYDVECSPTVIPTIWGGNLGAI